MTIRIEWLNENRSRAQVTLEPGWLGDVDDTGVGDRLEAALEDARRWTDVESLPTAKVVRVRES